MNNDKARLDIEDNRKPRVLLVIPARNEEDRMPLVVKDCLALEKEGCIDDFVVVNDKSRDRTADCVREFGGTVVDQKIGDPGKGEALLEGMRYAKKNKFDIVVGIDADYTSISAKHINALVSELVSNPQIAVTVYPCHEDGAMDSEGRKESYRVSGQRAYRMSQFDFLFSEWTPRDGKLEVFIAESKTAKRFIRGVSGYALETYLDQAPSFAKRVLFLSPYAYEPMLFAKAGRNSMLFNKQRGDIGNAISLIRDRTEQCQRIMEKRRKDELQEKSYVLMIKEIKKAKV